MLNSTKTWQERLSILLKEDGNNLLTVNKFLEIKQFISDLRKRDMEELIEMLPKDDNSETFLYRNRVKKIIQDYYENN